MVEKECSTEMLLHDMDISCLMVYTQQIEEGKLKEESREKKRSIIEDDDPSHARSDGHGRLKYRQKFPGQGSRNTPKFNQEMVSNLKPQGDSSGVLLPGCSKCDRRYVGECLAGSNVCFGCGELGHKIRHCPTFARNKGDSRRRYQPYPSSSPICSGGNSPKKNRFYALQARGEQECPPNIAPDMCFMLV
ncbi:uncharacterized protein LOC125869803 [Solanum stenotomum]|uniref:uncharacterized protein LOC125869803 n=1 Tax=Solanum stenotomum TaxID=172797 RepID=UPI0020CFFCB4|nr:uncharacterized protein LOC125869803 [Solanum stenotomum]